MTYKVDLYDKIKKLSGMTHSFIARTEYLVKGGDTIRETNVKM